MDIKLIFTIWVTGTEILIKRKETFMNRQTLANLAGPFFYNHIIKDLMANGEAQIIDDARGITLKYKVEAVGGN